MVIVSRLFSIFVAFVASFLLIGSAQAEVKVLTSIKPLQLIAAAVQDGVAIPEVLAAAGCLASQLRCCAHPTYARCNRWILLYWIGPDMEGFLPSGAQWSYAAQRRRAGFAGPETAPLRRR